MTASFAGTPMGVGHVGSCTQKAALTCSTADDSPLRPSFCPVVHADDAAADPGRNPILLPPRTRADVLQDRPAGGTAEEVAAANPHLVADHPAMVGYQQVDAPPAPAAGREQQGTDASSGGNSSGWDTADMSGLEVPELAVLPPGGS
jgi:hypothetical protein